MLNLILLYIFGIDLHGIEQKGKLIRIISR